MEWLILRSVMATNPYSSRMVSTGAAYGYRKDVARLVAAGANHLLPAFLPRVLRADGQASRAFRSASSVFLLGSIGSHKPTGLPSIGRWPLVFILLKNWRRLTQEYIFGWRRQIAVAGLPEFKTARKYLLHPRSSFPAAEIDFDSD